MIIQTLTIFIINIWKDENWWNIFDEFGVKLHLIFRSFSLSFSFFFFFLLLFWQN